MYHFDASKLTEEDENAAISTFRAASNFSSPCASRCSIQSVLALKTSAPSPSPSHASHEPTSTKSSLIESSSKDLATSAAPSPTTIRRKSPSVWPYAVGRLSAVGSINSGIIRPCTPACSCASAWLAPGCSCACGWYGGCGGLAAAELKKYDEPTEGKEEMLPEGEVGQEDESWWGEFGIEAIGTLCGCSMWECNERTVDTLVLAVHSSLSASMVVVVVVDIMKVERAEATTRSQRYANPVHLQIALQNAITEVA